MDQVPFTWGPRPSCIAPKPDCDRISARRMDALYGQRFLLLGVKFRWNYRYPSSQWYLSRTLNCLKQKKRRIYSQKIPSLLWEPSDFSIYYTFSSSQAYLSMDYLSYVNLGQELLFCLWAFLFQF